MGRTRCQDIRDRLPDAPPRPLDAATLRRHQEIDEAVVDSRWRDRRRTELWRTIVETALLLGFVTLLIAGLRPVPLAVALLLAGPAAGAVIHATGAGRGGAALWGTLAFLLLVVPSTFHFASVGLVLGGPFAAIAFFAYGVRRESRAFPGWE